MTLELTTTPAAEPIHLDQAKLHLRVDTTDDDTLIAGLISAARARCESFTRRALVMRDFRARYDDFPMRFDLPYAPLQAVSGITYTDTNGDSQTLATSLYQVDRFKEPGQVLEAYNTTWPSTYDDINVVSVSYTAGYVLQATVDVASDVLSAAGHPFADGDTVRMQLSGGADRALYSGLALNADYFVRDAVSGVSFKLAATAGGDAIEVSGTLTGSMMVGRDIIPEPLISGMLLYLTALYENRGETDFAIPAPVMALWGPYQLEAF